MGTRADAGKNFDPRRGLAALAQLGARTDLSRFPEAGYAAIGRLGAQPGTAIEVVAERGHARIALGLKPPGWRELARYSMLRLR